MGFFGIKFSDSETVSTGVDIGAKSVKAVQLVKKEGKIFLKDYVFAEIDRDLVKAGTIGVLDSTAGKIIKKIFQEAEIDTSKINVSVPSFASLITVIEIPKMGTEDIDKVIQLEAPKYIPVKLEDVIYDWQILESSKNQPAQDDNKKTSNENVDSLKSAKDLIKNQTQDLTKFSGEKMKILVVAIMKEISSQYERIFSGSDFEIDSLEVDSFSLVRSLIRDNKDCSLILDIGRRVTNMLIVCQGNILINRTIDIAGEKITGTISQGMGIDAKRAEQLKFEDGIEVASRGDGGVGMLAPVLGIIVGEIKRTLKIFQDKNPNHELKKIVFAGGSSQMKGLKEYFSEQLKMEVVVANPLSGIEIDPKIEKKFDKLAPFFSVAIGLALLGLGDVAHSDGKNSPNAETEGQKNKTKEDSLTQKSSENTEDFDDDSSTIDAEEGDAEDSE